MKSPILKEITLINDGSTGASVYLYQRASGRCRLYWNALDQDGSEGGTIATFIQKDWPQAVARAREELLSWSPA